MWRRRQINRDIQFCHPRWKQEKTFLEHEMNNLDAASTGLLKDPWNIIQLLTYMSIMLVIITRIVHLLHHDHNLNEGNDDSIHKRAYALSLIFLWIHFMKSCRAFTTLGLFISMLGYVVRKTLIFALLCFEILIPYMVGFWILFGGSEHAKTMEEEGYDSGDWKYAHNLMFSVWQITLVNKRDDAIIAVDKFIAQVWTPSFSDYFAVFPFCYLHILLRR